MGRYILHDDGFATGQWFTGVASTRLIGKVWLSGTFNMCKAVARDGQSLKVYDMRGTYLHQRNYIAVQ